MNKYLYVLFFEDYFTCTILPNEGAFEVLGGNQHREQLYFYVNGGDVRNDAFAKDRFEAADSQAFGDFFEIIQKGDKTFRRFDLELPPIELLHDALNRTKSNYSERMRAFGASGPEEQIPTVVLFLPGTPEAARKIISNYISDEGFAVESEADYLDSLLLSLQRKGVIGQLGNVSVIDSSFGDLYFYYIDNRAGKQNRATEVFVGKGVDHRVGNLARLLVEKAARKAASRILNDRSALDLEVKRFHRKAAQEIGHFEFGELELKIELSDFSHATVTIDERELQQMSAESFQFVKVKYIDFISLHSNLARTEKIVLNGPLVSSQAYVQFFAGSFGAAKIATPPGDPGELLTRGIAASRPTFSDGGEELEIRITVTKKPPLPPASIGSSIAKPQLPPLPPPTISPPRPGNPKDARTEARPEVEKKSVDKAVGKEKIGPPPLPSFNGPPLGRPSVPPLPSATAKPASADKTQTAGESKSNIVVGPPLPPLRGDGSKSKKQEATSSLKLPPVPPLPPLKRKK